VHKSTNKSQARPILASPTLLGPGRWRLKLRITPKCEWRMKLNRGLGEPARKVNAQMSELRTLRTPPI
jgi:hypothetical protein